MVVVGLTFVLSLPHDTAPTPLLIEHVVALVIPLQESADEWPGVIVGWLAVNEPTVGGVGSAEVGPRPRTSKTS